jgi:hypothetical protein
MLSIPRRFSILVALLLAGGAASVAQTPSLSIPERIAALKAGLAASQASLRQYQWIETTVVTLNGDEKSRKQQRCYYGADGTLQKEMLDASAPAAKKPGLRGMIIAKKTGELTAYMQSAVGLVKTYVPPNPAKIQAAKDAGNVTINSVVAGQTARINLHNYQKPGDNLAIDINIADNRIAALGVSSYLDTTTTDVVTMVAHMGQLPDGTVYTSDITLNAPTKNVIVTVQNSAYQKTAP